MNAARERSEQCGESESVSGANARENEGANGPVLYLLDDVLVIKILNHSLGARMANNSLN